MADLLQFTAKPPLSISDLPPLIMGGAVFNTQYAKDPSKLPIKELLQTAFDKGLRALDTSPYYGQSEELIGAALKEIAPVWPRESYFICTKAGRIQLDEFDYSRASVRQSVVRSLQRLNTTYLDLVYMHDVEFVAEEDVYEALRELRQLKQEGVVKNIGVSGYPVDYLLKLATECSTTHVGDIGPLDAVLSYSHGCIQNTRLFELYDAFVATGIKKLMNGSILSMSLLRSGVTHAFHPAPQALKDRVDAVAQQLLTQNIELADLATRFALKRWLFEIGNEGHNDQNKGAALPWNRTNSVVLGVSSLAELAAAIDAYYLVERNDDNGDEQLFEQFRHDLGPEHYNETWASGRF